MGLEGLGLEFRVPGCPRLQGLGYRDSGVGCVLLGLGFGVPSRGSLGIQRPPLKGPFFFSLRDPELLQGSRVPFWGV